MPNKPGKLGDYKAYCDRTGFRVYASDCRMQWNGLFVRKKSWEARQPQDYVKSKKDRQTVSIARPGANEPQFLAFGEVKPEDL